VYVEFYTSHPGADDDYHQLSDTNGSASGCGEYYTTYGPVTMINGHLRGTSGETGWIFP
jgi:hypothetical protein